MNTNKNVTETPSHGEVYPLISVIVAVYNVERFLPDCVESLRCQTYKNLEIILVDDGSPDRCGELCDQAAQSDSRVRVIHQENGGLSKARNAGLDIATGAYICFVDSDDFLEPDHISTLFRVLLDNSADLAVCVSYSRVPENASYRRPTDSSMSMGSSADCPCECLTKREAVERALTSGVPVMAYGKLYRAELLSGIRFPEGKLYEDLSVMFDILLRTGRIVTFHTDTSARSNSEYSIGCCAWEILSLGRLQSCGVSRCIWMSVLAAFLCFSTGERRKYEHCHEPVLHRGKRHGP